MDGIFEELRKQGEELQPKLIRYRRDFHAFPELRMDTPVTEEKIVSYLRSIGISEIRTGIGGRGAAAMVRGALPGKCLAVRSDADGLPIREETGLPFAAQNGNMHACGHDFHMAAALGAAELVFRHRKQLRGSVKFIFQPYEEGDHGSRMMIEDGVLKDPDVDAILGMHNGCHLDRDTRAGDVLVTAGPSSANIFAYRAVFHGSGGHVCLARTSVNPLKAAAEAILKITELAEAHPDAVCAVTVCQGGVRNNVIPESCRIEGSVRSFDRKEHAVLREGVWNALTAAAEKAGAGLEKEVTIDLMCTKNDRDLYERFCRTVGKVWPEGGCRPLEPVSMIGEDFARYTELIPGLYFFLCAKPEGARYPLHHPKFDLDESVLAKGSVLLAAFALDWQSEKV